MTRFRQTIAAYVCVATFYADTVGLVEMRLYWEFPWVPYVADHQSLLMIIFIHHIMVETE